MHNDISHFDGKRFSYTYENGWAFTNIFPGDLRITRVEGRGVLREKMTATKVGHGRFIIAWIDDEMGPITQFVDFEVNKLWCSVHYEDKMQIWEAQITEFEDA